MGEESHTPSRNCCKRCKYTHVAGTGAALLIYYFEFRRDGHRSPGFVCFPRAAGPICQSTTGNATARHTHFQSRGLCEQHCKALVPTPLPSLPTPALLPSPLPTSMPTQAESFPCMRGYIQYCASSPSQAPNDCTTCVADHMSGLMQGGCTPLRLRLLMGN